MTARLPYVPSRTKVAELQAKVAELETQLRQEREAHAESKKQWNEMWVEWEVAARQKIEDDAQIARLKVVYEEDQAQVARLQATISQLRGLLERSLNTLDPHEADLDGKALLHEIPAALDTCPAPEGGSLKDPIAVELGRRGGLKGGLARASKLSPERRKQIARNAAQERWLGSGNPLAMQHLEDMEILRLANITGKPEETKRDE